jgi:hypothetical protein
MIDEALNDGRTSEITLPPLPARKGLAKVLVDAGGDAASRRLWQAGGRIVYDIDPDLWAALGDTDDDTTVPLSVFARLPHSNPFVALPEPMDLPLLDGGTQRVGGFFVVGKNGHGDHFHQVSTHSPAARSLGLVIGGQVFDPDGRPLLTPDGVQDMIWSRVTLTAGHRAEPTMGELIAAIVARYRHDLSTADAVNETLPARIRRCVSVLVYLCATNADLRPLPASVARRQGKTRGQGKPARTVQVGYRVGAALRRWHAGQHRTAGQPTGQRRAPHVRRAHFHTYRVGPGRTDTRVRWLAPIPINMPELAETTTVVPVAG